MIILISEDLPPVGVCVLHMHAVWSSIADDIEWFVVQLGLDRQWFLIKPPDLSVSWVSCFYNHSHIGDEIKVLVWVHVGNNVEWSFNIETELFIQFSLLWLFWPFISIDDFPLLTNGTSSLTVWNSWAASNSSIFSIKSTININNLSFVVDKIVTLKSEELPPSWVVSSDSQVVLASIAWNIQCMVFIPHWSDSLWSLIEVELLTNSTLHVSSKLKSWRVDCFHYSSHW